jgi:hypothetical protein
MVFSFNRSNPEGSEVLPACNRQTIAVDKSDVVILIGDDACGLPRGWKCDRCSVMIGSGAHSGVCCAPLKAQFPALIESAPEAQSLQPAAPSLYRKTYPRGKRKEVSRRQEQEAVDSSK